jgi:hypothetical protein
MLLADNVSNVLKNIRNNVDEGFEQIFMEVKEKCISHIDISLYVYGMSLDIEITLPRVSNIQENRFNVKTTRPNDYYEISLFIPFIDNFIIGSLYINI